MKNALGTLVMRIRHDPTEEPYQDKLFYTLVVVVLVIGTALVVDRLLRNSF